MKKRATKKYSLETAMRKIAWNLASDFQTNLGDCSFASDFQSLIMKEDVSAVRQLDPLSNFSMEAYEFKCAFQIDSLLKRFRFKKDLYSETELVQKAINTFDETQDRIRIVDLSTLSESTKQVIVYAREYIHRILGEYCDEEVRERARFGKRASVGIPARSACEAERWEPSISGTPNQIFWFDSEMSQNPHVPEYWRQRLERDPNRSIYQETRTLALTLVPKTFKSLRSIMPNTTIGSYYTYGVGEMIRLRLKRGGYDIRTLQERHKYLARYASVCNDYTTADLSAASDSISRKLVMLLLPTAWFDPMDQMRVGTVRLPDGREVESETFCTMGIGYTFPLQTLIFLSLLKAILRVQPERLHRQIISVYGDDMIYPSALHEDVLYHFEQLGFVVNKDKTFCDGPFRESCGGDYYHGVDVRPFQPRNGSLFVDSISYEATLYKYVNNLLRRWTEYEIPKTLNYLLSEISSMTKIKLVPEEFTDDAGVRVARVLPDFLSGWECSLPKSVGHGVFRFSYLLHRCSKRKEERHGPYYWLRLRSTDHDSYFRYSHEAVRAHTFLVNLIDELTGCIRDVQSPLQFEVDKESRPYRSFSGKRVKRLASYVVVNNTGRYKRQSGTSTF